MRRGDRCANTGIFLAQYRCMRHKNRLLAHKSYLRQTRMPKRLPHDLFERVKNALDSAPQGRGLAELQAALRGVVSRRSLQRRLEGWVNSAAIHAVGVRRGRRYFASGRRPIPVPIIEAGSLAIAVDRSTVTPPDAIAIATSSQQIQLLIRRAWGARNNKYGQFQLRRLPCPEKKRRRRQAQALA
jgi:hypothetical protein